MSFSIRVEGMEDVKRLMRDTKRQTKAGTKVGLRQVGLFTEGEVKQSIAGRNREFRSVDTGRFLTSVTSSSDESTATVSSNVSYSKFLEFGTSSITARSHFRNTVARNKKKIRDFLDRAIKDKVK